MPDRHAWKKKLPRLHLRANTGEPLTRADLDHKPVWAVEDGQGRVFVTHLTRAEGRAIIDGVVAGGPLERPKPSPV